MGSSYTVAFGKVNPLVSPGVGGRVRLKETVLVRMLGLRVPFLLLIRPSVVELDDEGCAIKVPLSFPNRNHVGSMYVGTLAAGADITSALNALRAIREGHPGVVP